MIIARKIEQLKTLLAKARLSGHKVGLVPTMGYLHEGHLSLVETIVPYVDLVVMSIFVNPTQFSPSEDYESYPRDLEKDIKRAESAGVEIIFSPSVREMYPKGYQSFIHVDKVSEGLCGASRPHHFRGVTTVVGKLFNIVQPDFAVFGEKDYQQLVVIKQMVKDLNFPVRILGSPIIREDDGLAKSSRNVYLSPEQRRNAPLLYCTLQSVKDAFEGGERTGKTLVEMTRQALDIPEVQIDYIELVHAESLQPLQGKIHSQPVLLALAVYMGSTRLIDNIRLQ
ncbi:pantoate--beta-alanine ligase [candidate division KSB1 bacterium]|nr:pantoate--beta-alanine ligase [candidate division KSB1 bacterium]